MTATATATAPASVPRVKVVRHDIALLRVVAIIGVVLIHISGLTVINKGLVGTRVWWTAQALNGASRYCVPLFVMVSGALLLRPNAAPVSLKDFYRRRLDRLLPALVVWHAVYLTFSMVVLHSYKRPLTALAILLAGRTYTALYFFWLILGLYLVTPAIQKVIADISRTALLQLGLVLLAVTCAWQTSTAFIHAHSAVDVAAVPTIWSYWVPYVGYFVLGAGMAQLTFPRRAALPAAVAFAVLAGVTVLQRAGKAPAELNQLSPASYNGWIVAGATVALFVLAAALLPARPGEPSRPLRFLTVLSNLTLGVFAMHLLVLYTLQKAPIFTVEHGATRLLELGYLCVATLTISWALAWVFSKLPGLRRLV